MIWLCPKLEAAVLACKIGRLGPGCFDAISIIRREGFYDGVYALIEPIESASVAWKCLLVPSDIWASIGRYLRPWFLGGQNLTIWIRWLVSSTIGSPCRAFEPSLNFGMLPAVGVEVVPTISSARLVQVYSDFDLLWEALFTMYVLHC